MQCLPLRRNVARRGLDQVMKAAQRPGDQRSIAKSRHVSASSELGSISLCQTKKYELGTLLSIPKNFLHARLASDIAPRPQGKKLKSNQGRDNKIKSTLLFECPERSGRRRAD